MQFLRADAHLGAKTELRAIREASGGVPVDGGGVDSAQELSGIRLVASDNGVGMLSGVLVDVRDRFLNIRRVELALRIALRFCFGFAGSVALGEATPAVR